MSSWAVVRVSSREMLSRKSESSDIGLYENAAVGVYALSEHLIW
jgi:hypothetical protein